MPGNTRTDQGPQHPSNQSANPASGPNKDISPDDADLYQEDEDSEDGRRKPAKTDH